MLVTKEKFNKVRIENILLNLLLLLRNVLIPKNLRMKLENPDVSKKRIINTAFDFNNADLNYKCELLVSNFKNLTDNVMPQKKVVCYEKRKWFSGKVFEIINIRDSKFRLTNDQN